MWSGHILASRERKSKIMGIICRDDISLVPQKVDFSFCQGNIIKMLYFRVINSIAIVFSRQKLKFPALFLCRILFCLLGPKSYRQIKKLYLNDKTVVQPKLVKCHLCWLTIFKRISIMWNNIEKSCMRLLRQILVIFNIFGALESNAVNCKQ